MPYIKSEDRPFYDALTNTITTKLMLEQFNFDVELQTLMTHILARTEDKQDGDFNYFITRLMKLLGFTDVNVTQFYHVRYASIVTAMLFDFIVKIYSQPKESYYRFNRAIGMLVACRKEMERRNGNKAKHAFDILDHLVKHLYDEVVAPYEDKKILENGDV